MFDFQNDAYAALKKNIDNLFATVPSANFDEGAKQAVLAASAPYVDFLARAVGVPAKDVRLVLRELSLDHRLFSLLREKLEKLAEYSQKGVRTGEIRVHTTTLYVIVRLLQPKVIVETGVANGKSSAFILRALARNGRGELCSIDLPTPQETARDGDDGVLPTGQETGWLVPEFLRDRWVVRLGDARELLPQLKAKIGSIDIFFHDSLHTYEHMTFELEHAKEWVRKGGLVLCDDIQDNEAFTNASRGLRRDAFGTFGAFHVSGNDER